MNINILLDTKDSFLHEYVDQLITALKDRSHSVIFWTDHKQLKKGDILFLLACKTILSKDQLKLHKHNLVIHPSKLPEGRGSAALVWKILEGENRIYLTLFEANEAIDQGNIYLQEYIDFEGHELSDEIRHKQASKTLEMAIKFMDNYTTICAFEQKGESSFYRRRTPEDSELDMDKTLRGQFNLLRVVDNKRYPAHFYHNGHKYILNITKEK